MTVPSVKADESKQSRGCIGWLFPGVKPKPMETRIGVGKNRILAAADGKVLVWRNQ